MIERTTNNLSTRRIFSSDRSIVWSVHPSNRIQGEEDTGFIKFNKHRSITSWSWNLVNIRRNGNAFVYDHHHHHHHHTCLLALFTSQRLKDWYLAFFILQGLHTFSSVGWFQWVVWVGLGRRDWLIDWLIAKHLLHKFIIAWVPPHRSLKRDF